MYPPGTRYFYGRHHIAHKTIKELQPCDHYRGEIISMAKGPFRSVRATISTLKQTRAIVEIAKVDNKFSEEYLLSQANSLENKSLSRSRKRGHQAISADGLSELHQVSKQQCIRFCVPMVVHHQPVNTFTVDNYHWEPKKLQEVDRKLWTGDERSACSKNPNRPADTDPAGNFCNERPKRIRKPTVRFMESQSKFAPGPQSRFVPSSPAPTPAQPLVISEASLPWGAWKGNKDPHIIFKEVDADLAALSALRTEKKKFCGPITDFARRYGVPDNSSASYVGFRMQVARNKFLSDDRYVHSDDSGHLLTDMGVSEIRNKFREGDCMKSASTMVSMKEHHQFQNICAARDTYKLVEELALVRDNRSRILRDIKNLENLPDFKNSRNSTYPARHLSPIPLRLRALLKDTITETRSGFVDLRTRGKKGCFGTKPNKPSHLSFEYKPGPAKKAKGRPDKDKEDWLRFIKRGGGIKLEVNTSRTTSSPHRTCISEGRKTCTKTFFLGNKANSIQAYQRACIKLHHQHIFPSLSQEQVAIFRRVWNDYTMKRFNTKIPWSTISKDDEENPFRRISLHYLYYNLKPRITLDDVQSPDFINEWEKLSTTYFGRVFSWYEMLRDDYGKLLYWDSTVREKYQGLDDLQTSLLALVCDKTVGANIATKEIATNKSTTQARFIEDDSESKDL